MFLLTLLPSCLEFALILLLVRSNSNASVSNQMDVLNAFYDHYPSVDNDGIGLIWSHRTNKRGHLKRALEDDSIHLIEADVFVYNGSAVMSHGLDEPSDFTVVEFLAANLNSTRMKGLKLDFKSLEGLHETLPVLRNMRINGELERLPILWLNADIIGSPGYPPKVNATDFLSSCLNFMPTTPLSVGWSVPLISTQTAATYTSEMVDDMLNATEHVTVPITFAIRAGYVHKCPIVILRLLQAKETNSITLWHASWDPIDDDYISGLRNLRANSKKNRIFYDVPADVVAVLLA